MHTSNFRKVKRVEDVIAIFAKVSKQIPSKLLMIGDGPERQNTEVLARSLCTQMDVRFLGKQEAVEELLAVADVFLMPSETESFGLAALEAMACEVPVVSSNAGGIPEVNIEGVTGFLLDVGDVDGMAKRTLELLQDDAKLEQFKKNAFAQAQQYAIENILPQYEAFYEKIKSSGKCK